MNPSEAIGRLQKARSAVSGATAANPSEQAAQQALIKRFDNRIGICQKDLQIREEYEENKKKLDALDESRAPHLEAMERHEDLKASLALKYRQRPLRTGHLSPNDRKRFEDSRAARDTSVGSLTAIDDQKKLLTARQNQLATDYQQLRKATAISGKLPATPTDSVCVPCLEQLAADFEPKQRRQAGGANVYPGRQNYGNCGIQSSAQLITATNGVAPDERKLLDEAVADNNAGDVFLGRLRRALFNEFNPESGGTGPAGRQAILAKHGVDSEIQKTTKDNLAKAIRDNKGIVVNVDAGRLWNDPQYLGGGHAIMVYDGDFDEQGNLTHVYLNDTGANQQGRKMKVDDFMKAANAKKPSSSMNVTKQPVW